MTAYYNEIDRYAAAWLRNLIAEGLIAEGEVDERSIADVSADDIRGFTQCHFFAGIGGWSLALRLAGWPDERPVWTGSCPCQPFSVAGQGKGQADARHLWPVLRELIRERRPSVFFGEQVAVAAGARPKDPRWFQREIEGLAGEQSGKSDGNCEGEPAGEPRLQYDLGRKEESEAQGPDLRSGSVPRPDNRARQPRAMRADGPPLQHGGRATGLGYPFSGPDQAGGGLHDLEHSGGPVRHQRDDADVGSGAGSLHFGGGEGEAGGEGDDAAIATVESAGASTVRHWFDGVCRDLSGIGYTIGSAIIPCCAVGAPHRRDRLWFVADGASGRRSCIQREVAPSGESEGSSGGYGRMCALAHAAGEGWRQTGSDTPGDPQEDGGRSGDWNGDGGPAYVTGADGKARRVEPSIRLLAHGVPARVGRLRAYGNAIVPQVAAEFIGAFMDCRP